jgi:DNA-binding protein H-NS
MIIMKWDRNGVIAMKRTELNRMNFDSLWALHVELSDVLRRKIQLMTAQLEDRLRRLQAPASARRRYPEVRPKYRNPDQPSENLGWSRQEAAMVGRAAKIGEADRRLQNQSAEQEPDRRPPSPHQQIVPKGAGCPLKKSSATFSMPVLPTARRSLSGPASFSIPIVLYELLVLPATSVVTAPHPAHTSLPAIDRRGTITVHRCP